MKAAARRSRWVAVSCVALACCLVVVVIGSVDAESGRSAAGHASTRTLKFVYAGSGFVHVRQHIDNIPGHEGGAYDDTYSKRVKWSIAWEVTIEDERVLVGEPTATVSGIASADKNSGFGLGSCSAPVKMLVVAGKPFVPTTFEVIDRTSQFLTVRLGGTGAFGSFPVAWAATSCLPAGNITGYVTSPANGAGAAWGKSWGAPEFKIALFNNYKITPASIGNTYPFPVQLPIKKIVFDWNARLTIAGYTNTQPTAPPKPAPPAKKPCKESANPLDDDTANIYMAELTQTLSGHVSVPGENLEGPLLLLMFAKNPKISEHPGVLLIARCSGFLSTDFRYTTTNRPQPIWELPEGSHLDVTSSPDALHIQVQAGTGTPEKTTVTINVTKAADQTLRAGKPLDLTLTGTFRVAGKPPVVATAKLTLIPPPPKAFIDSVVISGTPQNPSIVVKGTNLGSKPAPSPPGSPSNQPPLCPVTITGDAGLDYGTSLYLADDARKMAAGRYRPEINELDCIGLIVTKFTPTEVDYRLGSYYAQVYPQYPLAAGDSIEIGVNGATKTVHVKYGTAVSN